MFFLNPNDPFPDPRLAREDGLLAIGGSLHPECVFNAHSHGIFPWYENDEMLMWWSPPQRGILRCQDRHLSRSLRRRLRQLPYRFSIDTAFDDVISACQYSHGDTWITQGMLQTYRSLHVQGRAHSFELWCENKLVGGLYGVSLNRVFCGESMFSHIPDASKIILVELCSFLLTQGFTTIDCQFLTPHLQSMGATEIPREDYLRLLDGDPDRLTGNWSLLSHSPNM